MFRPFLTLVRCLFLIVLITFGLPSAVAKELPLATSTAADDVSLPTPAALHHSIALDRYIGKVCKRHCVDSDLLLWAVTEAAQQLKVDANDLLAIIRIESSFKPRALNKANGRSVGLTQIQVRWHKDKFASSDYFDVMDNVRAGALIYKSCTTRWKGSREKALWCYNGHQKAGMKHYVPKVLKASKEIRSLGLTFT